VAERGRLAPLAGSPGPPGSPSSAGALPCLLPSDCAGWRACVQAVVLRPAPMFGTEDRLLKHIASLAKRLPAVPLIGGGATK
jgi:hypothetical protein